MITRIGCIGFVLVVILLVLVGILATRASLVAKRAAAIEKLAMITEQIDKVPGVFDRTYALGCSNTSAAAIDEIKKNIGKIDKESLVALDMTWIKIEAVWGLMANECLREGNSQAFVDSRIEFEGIRNRRSIERGKYKSAAEIYNEALKQFPANLGITGLKPLETGEGQ
jgi:hypothetical protein